MMSENELTDPRTIPGDMAGPGGPRDEGGVVLDVRNAVLLSGISASTADRGDGLLLAMVLHGRVNKTTDETSVLYLTDLGGAAGLISSLVGVVVRAAEERGQPYTSEFLVELLKGLQEVANA